jgi:hypothetical protein
MPCIGLLTPINKNYLKSSIVKKLKPIPGLKFTYTKMYFNCAHFMQQSIRKEKRSSKDSCLCAAIKRNYIAIYG